MWPALACAVTAAIGFSLVLVAFAPGYMSNDSIDQLHQARTAVYLQTHPPIMAWLWRQLDHFWPGPIGMLVVQNLWFWAGLGLLAYLALRRWGPLGVLAVGAVPSVGALLSTIWGDTQLGAVLTLAVALLVCLERRFSWPLFAAAALLLLYGDSVRGNAPTAGLPLLVWTGWRMAKELTFARRRWQRVAVALGFAFLVHETGAAINARLVQLHGPPYQASLVHDLVGISVETGQDLLPDYIEHGPKGVPFAVLASRYHIDNLDSLFFSQDGKVVRSTKDPVELSALHHAWLHAVRTYPGWFLHNRWVLFRRLIGLEGNVQYPYHWGIEKNEYGIVFTRTPANVTEMQYLALTRTSFFFRAWVYLLLAGAVIAFSAWRRRIRLSTCVALSALLYAAPYFLLAPVPSFRYVWWCVIAGLLLPLLLLAERRPPLPKVPAPAA